MPTLTTANSQMMLSVTTLFPTPVPIQGYATDDAFDTDEIESAETKMGVDGRLSAGYTPYEVPLSIHLQADSPSNDLFDAWVAFEAQNKEKYVCNGTILIQGTGKLHTFTRGFLVKGSVMPAAKKTLDPRVFTIHFNSHSVAPA